MVTKQPKENTHGDWFKIVFLKLDRNRKLAWAVDVMMTGAKRIYILIFIHTVYIFIKFD